MMQVFEKKMSEMLYSIADGPMRLTVVVGPVGVSNYHLLTSLSTVSSYGIC
jgi:hypothetical protein